MRLNKDITEQVKLMLELYTAKGSKLENLVVTGSKEFEDETIKQILVKIEKIKDITNENFKYGILNWLH